MTASTATARRPSSAGMWANPRPSPVSRVGSAMRMEPGQGASLVRGRRGDARTGDLLAIFFFFFFSDSAAAAAVPRTRVVVYWCPMAVRDDSRRSTSPEIDGVAVAGLEPECQPLTFATSFIELYQETFVSMVRLGVALTGSQALAEDLVHDAFVRVHARWAKVESPNAYLRAAVVNACRSASRRARRERKYRESRPASSVRLPRGGRAVRRAGAAAVPATRRAGVAVLRGPATGGDRGSPGLSGRDRRLARPSGPRAAEKGDRAMNDAELGGSIERSVAGHVAEITTRPDTQQLLARLERRHARQRRWLIVVTALGPRGRRSRRLSRRRFRWAQPGGHLGRRGE